VVCWEETWLPFSESRDPEGEVMCAFCVLIYVNIYVHVNTYVHVNIYMHVYIYIYICMYMYTHMYRYVYKYVYTCGVGRRRGYRLLSHGIPKER